MAHYDNFHSRFVARAKIFLPLAGLSLLATIFLFARSSDDTSSLPYAQTELDALAKEQRLDGPSFATVTQDGAQLVISSERVRPDASDDKVVNSTRIHGQLMIPENGTVTLQAQNGVIDGTSGVAELSGNVQFNTTTGYALTTDRIATMLDVSKIESPGAVEGFAPFGQISAGSMEISQDIESERYLLVFKQRVKLVYQP
jgi:lipopolysaccharide export system protein LptC